MPKSPLVKSFLFLFSSGLVGAIYMGSLVLFKTVFHFNPALSVTIAYISAMLIYFFLNKRVVFKTKHSKTTFKEIWRFGLLVTINYFITLGIVTFIYQYTREIYSGSIAAGIVTISLTYFVLDKYLFKSKL